MMTLEKMICFATVVSTKQKEGNKIVQMIFCLVRRNFEEKKDS